MAIGCVVLCLVVKVSGAADAKRGRDGDEVSSLRKAVLARFDVNQNGRLDHTEKLKALRELTGRDNSDSELNALREQILDRFDKNGNDKLERSEARAALSALFPRPKTDGDDESQPATAATAATGSTAGTGAGSLVDRGRATAAIADDPTAAVALTAQLIASTGIDTSSAQQLALQRFDLNGDGVLDASELAAAQAQLLRLLAAASAISNTTGTSSTLPLVTYLPAAGTTSTSTTSTPTSTSTSGMCSNMGGSGTGSGSSSGSVSSSALLNALARGTLNTAAVNANNRGSTGLTSTATATTSHFRGGRRR